MKKNTYKPAIVISDDVAKERVKLQRKFGFDEVICVKAVGVNRGHPIVLVTGVDSCRTITVEVSKTLGLKRKRFRGVSSKRLIGHITIEDIVNGSIVYKKGTRSGGPKEKLGKLI
ncbi:hypothetical protein [Vibrio sp. Hal054]|uniref:hypothetical protein n=1 Tax=Vibrio sp. Hal054 TaxID=3035158 RepID=UPI00301D4627